MLAPCSNGKNVYNHSDIVESKDFKPEQLDQLTKGGFLKPYVPGETTQAATTAPITPQHPVIANFAKAGKAAIAMVCQAHNATKEQTEEAQGNFAEFIERLCSPDEDLFEGEEDGGAEGEPAKTAEAPKAAEVKTNAKTEPAAGESPLLAQIAAQAAEDNKDASKGKESTKPAAEAPKKDEKLKGKK